ncbi:MAG: sugar phosphate nucleotidyltransferase, partial [Thermoanaerobaculia bacterium]
MVERAEAPLLRTDGDSAGRNKFWAIVLAGGEGIRLRPLIRRLFGEDRPKQYASLVGSRSLLRATLDRVALKVPLDKTVVVTSRWHAQYAAAEFTADPTPRLLIQPRDIGTAAGVLFPAYWVRHQDPEAVIAVFPSDHFILDESAFMNHVEEMAVFAGRHPDR